MLLPSYASNHYKSAHKRFVKQMIEQFFETELPKTFGPNLRSTIADKILEIVQSNLNDKQNLKAGQIFWNAVHKDTRPDSRKMKLVPVILTMINEEDISKLEKGLSFPKHRQNVIARITTEAYEQDALLSMRDIGILMATDLARVSSLRSQYEKANNVSLPHTGNLQDMGSCLTHKYQIVYKSVVEKKDPPVIAKETNHTIRADRKSVV